MRSARVAAALLTAAAPAGAAERTPALGPDLQHFHYPYPVRWFATRSPGVAVRMAYLDVAPTTAGNGRTAVLLHGKNFCAATWGETARALAAHGYRVIVPDQVGFCKSSKPAGFQYSVPTLAALTAELLDRVGTDRPILVGHSTGGIIAMRYALLFPARLSKLVLVNPLGLNDTLAEGVLYAPLGTLRAEEAKTDAASIRAYQRRTYYHGEWRPAYDRWVTMLAGQYVGPGGEAARDAQARLSEMIESGPVAADIPRIAAPTTLIIGQADTTAYRASSAPTAVAAHVRTVPEAAETAVRRFPRADLVRLDGLGHAPMVEDPARFQAVLLRALAGA